MKIADKIIIMLAEEMAIILVVVEAPLVVVRWPSGRGEGSPCNGIRGSSNRGNEVSNSSDENRDNPFRNGG